MRVLSVTHGSTVPGGVFEEVVEDAGHDLERWSVPDGPAPRTTNEYRAVMAFGGSMHPDQDEHFPWLEREAAFLHEALELEVAVLGVCLGAQMIARAAGAEVRPSPVSEVGWYDVDLTPGGARDHVLGALPARSSAFQWHHYTFDLPPGGTELARSEACLQAFRVGNAWGIQFHAEVTLPMIEAWLDEDPEDVPDPDALLAETRRRIGTWNDHGRRLCGAFLEAAG